MKLLREVQNMMEKELKSFAERLKDRIIYASVYNDIDWNQQEICWRNSPSAAEHAKYFPRGYWSFLGPGSEEKWYGTLAYKPDGVWDKVAEEMMVFRVTSPLCRGRL